MLVCGAQLREWAELDDIEALDEEAFEFSDQKMKIHDIAGAMGIPLENLVRIRPRVPLSARMCVR